VTSMKPLRGVTSRRSSGPDNLLHALRIARDTADIRFERADVDHLASPRADRIGAASMISASSMLCTSSGSCPR
jgi:hypothetical protein